MHVFNCDNFSTIRKYIFFQYLSITWKMLIYHLSIIFLILSPTPTNRCSKSQNFGICACFFLYANWCQMGMVTSSSRSNEGLLSGREGVWSLSCSCLGAPSVAMSHTHSLFFSSSSTSTSSENETDNHYQKQLSLEIDDFVMTNSIRQLQE